MFAEPGDDRERFRDDRPRRRRQRDILGVNRFDRLPIDERLPLPYQVTFRLLMRVEELEEADAQFQLKLEKCSMEPLINQSISTFEPPMFSQRGQGFLHGVLSEVPPMTMQLVHRFLDVAALGLENQMRLEVLNLDELFNVFEKPRFDEVLELSSFGMGSLPNVGTYVERVSYQSFENTCSNVRLINNSLSTINNVAGSHVLSAWLDVSFSKRMLNINFAVPMAEIHMDGLKFGGYRLTLHFASIREIIVCPDFNAAEHLIIIRFKTPPQLWRAHAKTLYGRVSLNLTDCRDWTRELEVRGAATMSCTKQDLGYSCVLALGLPKKPPIPTDAAPYERLCTEQTDLIHNDMSQRIFSLLGRLQTIAKCKVIFSGIHRICVRSAPNVVLPLYDSFRANYAIHGLIERGYAIIDQLYLILPCQRAEEIPLFFDKIAESLESNRDVCEECLEDLLSICDESRLDSLIYSFDKLFQQKSQAATDSVQYTRIADIPRNCVLVRKVIVTPLRRVFLPPEVMMSNRVVRQFGEEAALRLTFRDDNGQRISLRNFARSSPKCQNNSMEIVEQMIKTSLLRPLEIGGKSFKFLAWSNSQMRDHGCYLYADIVKDDAFTYEYVTVENIRAWMGDFSAARSVPKLMSRMGQCFTQAQPTIIVKPSDWHLVNDFESAFIDPFSHKNYVFSDGVGRISERFANKVAAILEISPVPSCFQVRFEGFKGIVVVWPNLVDSRFYRDLVFRRSQQKFVDANDSSGSPLEVVKYSMPSLVCLNRPLIMILDQVMQKQNLARHSILKKRVTEIVEKELEILGAMLYDNRLAASQLVMRTNCWVNFEKVRYAGMHLTDEPFFRQMLLSIYKYCVCQDLVKMKVPLPPECGRTMYGVVDELGYLNPGQVFVQYSPNILQATVYSKIHVGPVMVTKNPCHVPGDVRMFEAVDLEAYHHLRDVIVFPRHGVRPHPDEMAGSDLDGDEYAVFFDPTLFYAENEAPMHFPKMSAQELDRSPTDEDMIDFFLTYLTQDTIGRVSNAHLVAADQLGIYDKVCERLAAKCSIAVDFPKTGQPAEALSAAERFDALPDFMGGAARNTYTSQWLLGRLYRKVSVLEKMLEVAPTDDTRLTRDSDDLIRDETLALDQPQMFAAAIRSRDVYNAKIQQILDEYGIEVEGEMISGHALSIRRITDMEKQDYSFYHADRLVAMRMQKIVESFRAEFFDEFGGESHCFEADPSGNMEFVGSDYALLKAQCWYTVAYGDDAREKSIRFRSFPWIIWDLLLTVRRRNRVRLYNQKRLYVVGESMLFSSLTTFILDYAQHHQEDVEAFAYALKDPYYPVQCFERYVALYGSKLALTLFFLDNWLKVVYNKVGFATRHLIMLCLGFGLGESPLGDTTERRLIPQRVDTLQEALTLRQDENAPHKFEQCGRLVLEFIRYLGSSRLGLADRLDLSTAGLSNRDADNRSVPCTLHNPADWAPINKVSSRQTQPSLLQLAYRTFHYATLTRTFEIFTTSANELLREQHT